MELMDELDDLPEELAEAHSRGWISDEAIADERARRPAPVVEEEQEAPQQPDLGHVLREQGQQNRELMAQIANRDTQRESAPQPPPIDFQYEFDPETGEKFTDETRDAIGSALNDYGKKFIPKIVEYVQQQQARSTAATLNAVQNTQQETAWFNESFPDVAYETPKEIQQSVAQAMLNDPNISQLSSRDRLQVYAARVRGVMDSVRGSVGGSPTRVGTRSGGLGAGGARASVGNSSRRVDPNGREGIDQFIQNFR